MDGGFIKIKTDEGRNFQRASRGPELSDASKQGRSFPSAQGMSGARKGPQGRRRSRHGRGEAPPSPPQAGCPAGRIPDFLRVWEGAERGWQGLAWVRAFGVSLKPGERFARTGPEKREKRAVVK